MARKHWIINHKTGAYVESYGETFDGEWKENYNHTKGADWLNVTAQSVWEHDKKNGIYYVYDLCRDGGIFTLLADVGKHTKEDIEKAKSELRRDQDVVSLRVESLHRVYGCDCCRDYNMPGQIVNANQWMACPKCNSQYIGGK